MDIIRNNKLITLTEQEMEAAYNEYRLALLSENALACLLRYLSDYGFTGEDGAQRFKNKYGFPVDSVFALQISGASLFERIAETFLEIRSDSVPDSRSWIDAIQNCLYDAGTPEEDS